MNSIHHTRIFLIFACISLASCSKEDSTLSQAEREKVLISIEGMIEAGDQCINDMPNAAGQRDYPTIFGNYDKVKVAYIEIVPLIDKKRVTSESIPTILHKLEQWETFIEKFREFKIGFDEMSSDAMNDHPELVKAIGNKLSEKDIEKMKARFSSTPEEIAERERKWNESESLLDLAISQTQKLRLATDLD